MCIRDRECDDVGVGHEVESRAALTEPADRGVGHHRFALHGLDQQAIFFAQQIAQFGLEFGFVAVRVDVPRGGERTGPLVAEAHDDLSENVLITGGLGEVVRDQIGAHGGLSGLSFALWAER